MAIRLQSAGERKVNWKVVLAALVLRPIKLIVVSLGGAKVIMPALELTTLPSDEPVILPVNVPGDGQFRVSWPVRFETAPLQVLVLLLLPSPGADDHGCACSKVAVIRVSNIGDCGRRQVLDRTAGELKVENSAIDPVVRAVLADIQHAAEDVKLTAVGTARFQAPCHSIGG